MTAFFVAGAFDDPPAEPDRVSGAAHPRETLALAGHAAAERQMLAAFRSGRLHHAWLLAGPRGIGKATLAWRFARFLLAHPEPGSMEVAMAADLAVPASHPVAGQVARLAHPDLALIRRSPTKDGKVVRGEITVEDVREGLALLGMTSGGGGWRVVIVDSADDMNRNAANALLKQLEEPPARTVFMLVSHQPATLLPTIRSRCRFLRLAPLAREEMATVLAAVRAAGGPDAPADDDAFADGSVGQALAGADPAERKLRLAARDLYRGLPRLDLDRLQTLLPELAGKQGESALAAVMEALGREIHAGLRARPDEPALLAARADLWDKLGRQAREIETFNLDRRPFLLQVFQDLADIERRHRAR
jgi:DNA polymerase-3 subunit delta'